MKEHPPRAEKLFVMMMTMALIFVCVRVDLAAS